METETPNHSPGALADDPSLDPPSPVVQCTATQGFTDWMAARQVSLLVSTYQAGKLMAIGWKDGRISLNSRNFDHAMGLDLRGDVLAVATAAQIQWYGNAPLLAADCPLGQPGTYDALYLQRASHHTGPLFVHDLAFDADGELWFVNTRFSCLATTSPSYSFVPRWQPSFIGELTPEDKCHLNGLAMHEGKPRTVTALGVSDEARGWRENKANGGVVIDVPSGEVVLAGLAMPHSPRWHNGHLWVLNSGAGELLRVNPDGQREVVCFLPGYLRGLAFAGDFALVGLCKIREKRVFGGLPIEKRTAKRKCGIAIVHLASGTMVGMFEFTGGVEEIYDIRVVEGVRQINLIPHGFPRMPGFGITAPDFSYWLLHTPDEAAEAPEEAPAAG